MIEMYLLQLLLPTLTTSSSKETATTHLPPLQVSTASPTPATKASASEKETTLENSGHFNILTIGAFQSSSITGAMTILICVVSFYSTTISAATPNVIKTIITPIQAIMFVFDLLFEIISANLILFRTVGSMIILTQQKRIGDGFLFYIFTVESHSVSPQITNETALTIIVLLVFTSNLIDPTEIVIDNTAVIELLRVRPLGLSFLSISSAIGPHSVFTQRTRAGLAILGVIEIILNETIASQRVDVGAALPMNVLALAIPIAIILLGFQAILINVTKISTVEAIVSIITIGVIESLIILTQRHALGSMFLLLFHGIFGSHSFLASRTSLGLAKLNAIKTIFVIVIVNYFEVSIAANATTLLIIVSSRDLAAIPFVSTNFDNVEAREKKQIQNHFYLG